MTFKWLSVICIIAVVQLSAQQCFEKFIQRGVTSRVLIASGANYIWINNQYNENCTQFIYSALPNSNNVMATMRYINKTSGALWDDTVFMGYNKRGSYTLYLTKDPNFNPQKPGNVVVFANVTFVDYAYDRQHNRLKYAMVVCPGTSTPFFYIVTNYNPATSLTIEGLKYELRRKTRIDANTGYSIPINANDCSAYNKQKYNKY